MTQQHMLTLRVTDKRVSLERAVERFERYCCQLYIVATGIVVVEMRVARNAQYMSTITTTPGITRQNHNNFCAVVCFVFCAGELHTLS